MSHLGSRVSALLDGELSPDAASRARAHAARCPACRTAIDHELAVRAALRAAAGPTPSGDLTDALLTLGGPSGPLPPRPGHLPGTPRPEALSLGSRPAGRGRLERRTAGTAPGWRGPGRRIRRGLVVAVAGGVSLAGAGLLSAVVLTAVVADPASVAPARSQLSDDPRGRVPATQSTTPAPTASPTTNVSATWVPPGATGTATTTAP
jgi:anti-sigma factor RsiW